MDRLLREVASNFWFEWVPEAKSLFLKFDPQLWTLCGRNPFRFLAYRAENPLAYERRFAELVTDPEYLAHYETVKKLWNTYMHPSSKTWIDENHPELKEKTIAYFSMEYGVETLKTYSGGLGILSGDHLRGASDLGLKFVAVGLFYLQGYYEQEVTKDGEMRVTYDSTVPPRSNVREYLPLEAIKKAGTRDDLIVQVPVAERVVKAKVWRARVGRVELLLLDTNIKENLIHDRHISRRLYASEKQYYEERKRRFEQEMVLGIGGVMALREAGYDPSFYHLNEGHVAFAILEILHQRMKHDHLNFSDARARDTRRIGFTSHTPVPEGNEQFDEAVARQNLGPYLDQFLRSEDQETIYNCARNKVNFFDMTKLSLLLADGFRNGVSQIHGDVSRHMWQYAWAGRYQKPADVPIGHITNGVHVPYWQAPEISALIKDAGGLENIQKISDEKLWQVHSYRKVRMIVKVREQAAYHLLRLGFPPDEVQRRTQFWLDPDAFMIGVARRFAGYKRITWFLEDEERLFTFLEDSFRKYGKPVQILFAGKPHPDNYQGRDQIRYVSQISMRLEERTHARNFKAAIFFIEGYDIDLARRLVSGIDIWLNNPIRPLEASGTSGMKAGMNGILNVSIPDGWVAEGIKTGENGWLFGKGHPETSREDRRELFDLFENTILPIYFERPEKKHNYSPRWLALMKRSIQTITSEYSIDRMLREYTEKMYLPGVRG